MYRSDYITNKFNNFLIKKDETNKRDHISSGKLSASMLNQPVQWQILKLIGVPGKDIDPQGLRNMYRGKQIENELMELLKEDITSSQKFVEYRNAVGYIDFTAYRYKFDTHQEEIPFEVKSVTRDKFARIEKCKAPDKGHLLQAAFYALAIKASKFGLIYINSSDDRDITWIIDELYRNEVNSAIDAFYGVLEAKKVPVFEPKEIWNKNPKYNSYPDFMLLTEKEIEDKLKVDYPFQYNKYKGIK